MALRVFTLIFLLFTTPAFAGLFDRPGESLFVPVDQAFAFDFQQRGEQLTLKWQIKPGYYLYRQQINIDPIGATLADFTLPAGEWHEDEFYGKSEIYTQSPGLTLRLLSADAGANVRVTYQGCAKAGFCYPPETKTVPLSVIAAQTGRAGANAPGSHADASASAHNSESTPVNPPHAAPVATATLPFSAFWALIIGIGVAFTPCVLPMYPLISSIVLGGRRRLSTARALLLAFIYVQGMALTYTALGLVVAAAGLQFQAALQHPYVLAGLSLLFILLALSMFGLFTLQLPSSLQTRLTQISNHQQGGSAGGVFAMGAISGLICSPCTTAPLSAILLYIAQSGNLGLGGGTLYLYALGMGLPLILITVFGNRLLPKSGPWMENVKIAFGFVILALPVFLLERVLGETWGLRMWSALSVAFFGWAFIVSLGSPRRTVRIAQILLFGAALVCARPLQDWAFGAPAALKQSHLNFTRIGNVAELEQALANAKGKAVMLDLYADWCIACKEFEKYTFSAQAVRQALGDTVLLQADVTANGPEDAALLKHLRVLGLPTILFYDRNGTEQSQARVTGFMNAGAFSAHLRNHLR
ncbi:protein-disulfide reductase DsbD [Enterobacteriaceae bacterium YMB-R22]|uniref:protein-disulfide reductase DsbD n=1 Tax=Tenebrionicola larvae TaxID=2815733 RepID=UPI002010DB7F|nr:protein-disulfide reductase DsbD [Tenebrionicola larvae]MBV4413546.1 protein-disulfide reductase DsbD [Tenebrionicola larvae]